MTIKNEWRENQTSFKKLYEKLLKVLFIRITNEVSYSGYGKEYTKTIQQSLISVHR